jgi:hypothetical protein
MVLLFQHQAGLGHGTPRTCVDGARYDIISLLGKRVTLVTPHSVDAIGAGVGLSRPFPWQTQIRHQANHLPAFSEPIEPNVNQAYSPEPLNAR